MSISKQEALHAAAPDLLRLARDYLKAVRFYADQDVRKGDDEGARLKWLNAILIEALIAKAEGRLGGTLAVPPLPADPLRDAAPDMLEALRRLVNAADNRENTMGCVSRLLDCKADLREAADVARAAITKAEGRANG